MKNAIDVSLFSKSTLNDLEMMTLKGGDLSKRNPCCSSKLNCSCPKQHCDCPIENEKCPSCVAIMGGNFSA